MVSKEEKLKKHSKLLLSKTNKANQTVLTHTILTSLRLQHTTSELGIWCGGFHAAMELILSYGDKGHSIPKLKDIEMVDRSGELESTMRIYMRSLFQVYENWRRKTEIRQSEKGKLFDFAESAISKFYEDYKKEEAKR